MSSFKFVLTDYQSKWSFNLHYFYRFGSATEGLGGANIWGRRNINIPQEERLHPDRVLDH